MISNIQPITRCRSPPYDVPADDRGSALPPYVFFAANAGVLQRARHSRAMTLGGNSKTSWVARRGSAFRGSPQRSRSAHASASETTGQKPHTPLAGHTRRRSPRTPRHFKPGDFSHTLDKFDPNESLSNRIRQAIQRCTPPRTTMPKKSNRKKQPRAQSETKNFSSEPLTVTASASVMKTGSAATSSSRRPTSSTPPEQAVIRRPCAPAALTSRKTSAQASAPSPPPTARATSTSKASKEPAWKLAAQQSKEEQIIRRRLDHDSAARRAQVIAGRPKQAGKTPVTKNIESAAAANSLVDVAAKLTASRRSATQCPSNTPQADAHGYQVGCDAGVGVGQTCVRESRIIVKRAGRRFVQDNGRRQESKGAVPEGGPARPVEEFPTLGRNYLQIEAPVPQRHQEQSPSEAVVPSNTLEVEEYPTLGRDDLPVVDSSGYLMRSPMLSGDPIRNFSAQGLLSMRF